MLSSNFACSQFGLIVPVDYAFIWENSIQSPVCKYANCIFLPVLLLKKSLLEGRGKKQADSSLRTAMQSVAGPRGGASTAQLVMEVVHCC